MKFGILKSKIETLLSESYSKKTFKQELSNFKKYVLENKNISKLYYLYDDLTSNKGINETIVETYINESISNYHKVVGKINSNDLTTLKNSIFDILFQYPDETIVYCGHGPNTTIGHEKKYNYINQY